MSSPNTVNDPGDVEFARRWLAGLAKHGDARIRRMVALAAELRGFGLSEPLALTLLCEVLRAQSGRATATKVAS
jgi:hypothetical protein